MYTPNAKQFRFHITVLRSFHECPASKLKNFLLCLILFHVRKYIPVAASHVQL